MIDFATVFLLAASISGTTDVLGDTDAIFHNGYDGDNCPAGRVVRSDITYPLGSSGTRPNVDLTAFENIWGHLTNSDEPVMWPGRPGTSPIIDQFARTGYLAAKFHTPAGLPQTMRGFFKNANYPAGPNLDFSITQQCADFNPTQSGCLATDIIGGDVPMVFWQSSLSNFNCVLEPDTDYFVNIRLATPDNDPRCRGSACLVHTVSYVNP
jgi:hypothetical protein